MKKIIALVLVAVMLAVTASAMHHAEGEDTTVVWRDDKTTVKHSFDTVFVDGKSQMDLGWANDGVGAKVLSNHPLYTTEPVGEGAAKVTETVALRGWVGMNQDNFAGVKVAEVGYYKNDNKATYVTSGALVDAEAAVVESGGEYRFEGLSMSVAGLTEPTLFTLAVKGTDGKLYDFAEFSINGQYVPSAEPTPGEPTPTNPTTADASIIAIAAVACIALAGVVAAKKVK